MSSNSEQNKTDAADAVNAALPDEATQEQAGQAISAALNSDEVKKQAYEDVKTLANTIREIRAGFIQVAGDLVGFDSANFLDINGKPIKLGSQWTPKIKLFDDTLQYSLEQATEAVVMMKSVSAILGAVTPVDGADLKTELTNFMTKLAVKEAESLQVKTQWTALADQVTLFAAVIDAALDKAEAAIKADLIKAKDHLADLQTELADLNEKIHSLGGAVIGTVAVGVAAAGVAIITLNPVAIVTAIASFFSAIGTAIALKKAMDDRDECEKNIEKVNREIVALNERVEELKKYRAKFEGTKGIVGDIATKISVIGNIWQTINLDMHALNTDLTNNIAGGAPITKFFLAKLQVSKDIYTHLTLLLETYVEQVTAAPKT